jgi:hypothetical protein
MCKRFAAALILAVLAAGCAAGPPPPQVQPSSHQSLPLPPLKPERPPPSAALPAFTLWQ